MGCSDEVLSQLQAASDNRSTSATLRNTDSSRSHAFYRVTIYCEEPVGQQQQGACDACGLQDALRGGGCN